MNKTQEFVTQYFDASNPEHVEAYAYYQHNEEFPEGFLPAGVKATPQLIESLSACLASAYTDNFDRVHSKREEKVARGIRPNSVNFGFTRNDSGGFKEISSEIKIVRLIFSLYLQHCSLRKVVEHLNTHAIRTRRGKKWFATSVYNILVNPVYLGKIVWRGQIHEGAHRAVISRRTFDKVAKILRANRRRPK